MGWLKRVRAGLAAAEKASELAQEVQTCQQRVLDLVDHVAALDETLVAQQRRNDDMLTEWASTLDKIGRWASRQSARERKDTHKKLDELGAGPAAAATATDAGPMTKPQLRALAARQRMGGAGVSSNGAE